jgi:hypothetical protein
MDLDTTGTVLWIAAGFLMMAGVAGVVLALLLDKSAAQSAEAERARKREIRPAVAVEKAPAKPVDEKVLVARKTAYRQGLMVLVGLAVLTAIEFWIGVTGSFTVLLFVLILAKAGLILQYYMHLNRLWSEEEAH